MLKLFVTLKFGKINSNLSLSFSSVKSSKASPEIERSKSSLVALKYRFNEMYFLENLLLVNLSYYILNNYHLMKTVF